MAIVERLRGALSRVNESIVATTWYAICCSGDIVAAAAYNRYNDGRRTLGPRGHLNVVTTVGVSGVR